MYEKADKGGNPLPRMWKKRQNTTACVAVLDAANRRNTEDGDEDYEKNRAEENDTSPYI